MSEPWGGTIAATRPDNMLTRVRALSQRGARTAKVLSRRFEQWAGGPRLIHDQDLEDKLQAAGLILQDLSALLAALRRLASAHLSCSVAHLQATSAMHDLGKALPASVQAGPVARNTLAAQSVSRSHSNFATDIDELSIRIDAILQASSAAHRDALRMREAYEAGRVALEVDCLEYERVLRAASPQRHVVTHAAAAQAADISQGMCPPTAARVVAAEARVVQGFNATQRLRADIIARAQVLTGDDVSVRVPVCGFY